MGHSGVNWNNVPHESILEQINGGAGVAPVNEAAVSYQRIAAALREADQDLRLALGSVGASWEGRASADMNTAATPLATWADEADVMATQTSTSTDVFGGQFANTRSAMPTVVAVPSGSWVDDTGLSSLPGVTTDRERAEEAADAAQQEAARRMEIYDNASYETVRTQYFSAPPAVVLEVAPASSAGGPSPYGSATTTGATADGGYYPTTGGFTAAPTVSSQAPQVGFATTTTPTWAPPPSPTPPTAVPPVPNPVPGIPPVGPGPTGPGGVGAWPPPAPAPGFSGPGGRPGSPGGPGAGRTGLRGAGPGLGGGRWPGGGVGPGGLGAAGGPGGPGGVGGSGGAGGPGGQGGVGAGAGAQGRGLAGRGLPGSAGGGFGPMAGGARGEDDTEHRRPDYLVETEDVWGDGVRVAPPVIGERPGG